MSDQETGKNSGEVELPEGHPKLEAMRFEDDPAWASYQRPMLERRLHAAGRHISKKPVA